MEQVAIGQRALESAEDTRHLVVASEYFKAALRLSPSNEIAATALDEAAARLFQARKPFQPQAPPYRPGDAVDVVSVKVTRGLQQSDKSGALYVVYEVVCTHQPTSSTLRAKGAPLEPENSWQKVSCDGDELSVNVYSEAGGNSTNCVIGCVWRDDRVRVLTTDSRYRISVSKRP